MVGKLPGTDITESWIDPRAVGRPQKHDDRFGYNPPAVVAPAMEQEQFEYDMQREVEAQILTNPATLAYTVQAMMDENKILQERLEALERKLDNGPEPYPERKRSSGRRSS